MENELTIKKCKSCGATVKVIEDCNCNGCGIVCCGEQMAKMIIRENENIVGSDLAKRAEEKVEKRIRKRKQREPGKILDEEK